MSNYPAPDPNNPQFPNSWGTGQNDYMLPNPDQPPAYGQQSGYQPQPPAFGQQSGYQPQPQPPAYGQQPGYQPQPPAFGQQPGYQQMYVSQVYVPQPQYTPMVPIIPMVAMYDPYAGQALAGMIIGIIALVLPLFWIMPVLGIVFSSLGMRSTTRKGMAIAGLVCSIVAIVTAFCWFPFLFI